MHPITTYSKISQSDSTSTVPPICLQVDLTHNSPEFSPHNPINPTSPQIDIPNYYTLHLLYLTTFSCSNQSLFNLDTANHLISGSDYCFLSKKQFETNNEVFKFFVDGVSEKKAFIYLHSSYFNLFKNADKIKHLGIIYEYEKVPQFFLQNTFLSKGKISKYTDININLNSYTIKHMTFNSRLEIFDNLIVKLQEFLGRKEEVNIISYHNSKNVMKLLFFPNELNCFKATTFSSKSNYILTLIQRIFDYCELPDLYRSYNQRYLDHRRFVNPTIKIMLLNELTERCGS